MASADVGAANSEVQTDQGQRRFACSVAVATVAPFVLVLAAHAGDVSQSGGMRLLGLVLAAHVATSLLFYVDPALELPTRDPVRYVLAPLAAVIVSVAVWLFGGPAFTAVLLLQQLWQIHHFTRQNLGVFSLYAKARGRERMADRERRLFDLTSYAGMVGSVGLVVDVPVRWFGLLPLAAAAVLLVTLRPMPTWRLCALAAAIVFYLPLFLFPLGLPVATAAYGFAHGAQYLLMMGHVRVRRHGIAALVGVVAVYTLGLWSGVAVGLFVGITFAHFIIDAGVWKMRDPAQRAWLGSRLAWL